MARKLAAGFFGALSLVMLAVSMGFAAMADITFGASNSLLAANACGVFALVAISLLRVDAD